jgi:hypothetical protein
MFSFFKKNALYVSIPPIMGQFNPTPEITAYEVALIFKSTRPDDFAISKEAVVRLEKSGVDKYFVFKK